MRGSNSYQQPSTVSGEAQALALFVLRLRRSGKPQI
jgi:hypothetical protein